MRLWTVLLIVGACGEAEAERPADTGDDTLDVVDADGDGVSPPEDCDDTDAGVSPEAAEVVYDGVDNDCDPTTVDDDLDGDGYPLAADCDDTDAEVIPEPLEICDDGIDNDCDGTSNDCALGAELPSPLTIVEHDAAGFGVRVVAHRDLDGDGIDDLVVSDNWGPQGASGAVSVHYGPIVEPYTRMDADALFLGPRVGESFGSMTAAADLDGDGFLDLVIGSYVRETLAIHYGTADRFEGIYEHGTHDARILGDARDRFAEQLVVVGDVDGDGSEDLLASAHGWDGDHTSTGKGAALLFYGARWDGDVALEDVVGPEYRGTDPYFAVGSALAGGDVNGDGSADLLFTSRELLGSDTAVAAHIVLGGQRVPAGPRLVDSSDWLLQGDPARFGVYPHLAVGDFDGDGVDDIALANERAGLDGVPTGLVRVFSGGPSVPPVRVASQAEWTVIGGAQELTSLDFDGDRRMDLAFLEFDTVRVVYGRRAPGVFEAQDEGAYRTSVRPWAATTVTGGGDVDGDGRNDLVWSLRSGIREPTELRIFSGTSW
jgi:hypothetical protein